MNGEKAELGCRADARRDRICVDGRPLRRADDAVLVDTSELDIEQSFALLKKTILDRIG